NFIDLEGLRQVVVGAFLHGGDRGFCARKRRHHEGYGLGRGFAQRVQEIKTCLARHLQIGDHDVEVVGLEREESAVDIPYARHVVALPTQQDLEELLHAALVVDDEDPGLRAHCGSSAWGSRMRNVVPAPTVLSTRSDPPWLSTIR